MVPQVTLYFKHNFKWWNFRKKVFMNKFDLYYADAHEFTKLRFSSAISSNNLINNSTQFYSSIHGDYIALTIPKDSPCVKELFKFFKEDK